MSCQPVCLIRIQPLPECMSRHTSDCRRRPSPSHIVATESAIPVPMPGLIYRYVDRGRLSELDRVITLMTQQIVVEVL
jgi:hypothetical protein